MKKIKIIAIALAMICTLCLLGCEKNPYPKAMPEDFSFSLTWNCYGVSSYDSTTGKLVKTTDATNPDDYVTYYELPSEEKERIYDYIRALNPESYPDTYNPHGKGVSEPPMTLILSVNVNGAQKIITVERTSLSFETRNRKGQTFLTTCEAIIGRLTTTEEWKALPDYEFYYD